VSPGQTLKGRSVPRCKMTVRMEKNNLEGHSIRDLRTESAWKQGQLADNMMKSRSLHLRTPDNHLEVLTNLCKGY